MAFSFLMRCRARASARLCSAAAAVARHPVRTPEQIKKADEIVAPLVASQTRMLTVLNAPLGRIAIGLAIFAGAGLFVVVLGVIGALATPGGFTFRLFGAALVAWGAPKAGASMEALSSAATLTSTRRVVRCERRIWRRYPGP